VLVETSLKVESYLDLKEFALLHDTFINISLLPCSGNMKHLCLLCKILFLIHLFFCLRENILAIHERMVL